MADDMTIDPAVRPVSVQCEDIQAVLFDYMSRELGDKQSFLVHEHLLKCAECRREAARIERAVEFLRNDKSFAPPQKLKSAIRRKLERVFLHPALDFIYVHRHVVAATLALLIVAVLAFIAGRCSMVKPQGRQLWLSPFENAIPSQGVSE